MNALRVTTLHRVAGTVSATGGLLLVIAGGADQDWATALSGAAGLVFAAYILRPRGI